MRAAGIQNVLDKSKLSSFCSLVMWLRSTNGCGERQSRDARYFRHLFWSNTTSRLLFWDTYCDAISRLHLPNGDPAYMPLTMRVAFSPIASYGEKLVARGRTREEPDAEFLRFSIMLGVSD